MTRLLLSVIAIAIFMSFFRLGSVTLFDVDEAVFAEATKEMVQSGNYITPTYNGENRYDKPILFYWLMAVSYKVFGINEFAARFPSAASGFILCLALFFFLRQFSDEKKAFYAVISLALSIYFFVYSHAAVTDMTLTLFITLSLFSFYLFLEKDRRYIYGFYIFSALAFLTKGLIGIAFPFGIVMIFMFIREGLKGIRSIFNLKAFILFSIIALPWYIAQVAINGQEFIQQFFIKHHFRRYTGVISGHRGPIYYFIFTLIIGMFPWIVFLPAGIRNVFKKNSEFQTHNSKINLFAFIWFVFIFVFFSFSTTKLPNYILPAIPAVSILISSGMAPEDRWQKTGSKIFIAVISLFLGIGFIISKRYYFKLGIHDANWTLYPALIMFAIAVLSIYIAIMESKGSSHKLLRFSGILVNFYNVLSCLMMAFLLVLSIRAVPVANQYLQGTLYKYSLYAKDRLRGDEKIIAFRINNPSIVFYSGHKIVNARSKDDLLSIINKGVSEKSKILWNSNGGKLIAISKTKDIEVLKDLGFKLIEDDGRYAILEGK